MHSIKTIKTKAILAAFIVGLNIFLFGNAVAENASKKASPKKEKFSYAAWLPYWKESEALQEIKPNLAKFKELSLFSYEVQPDGTIKDKFKIKGELWQNFLPEAKKVKIKTIPTIAWFNGDEIHKFLSKKKNREKHIAEIISLARENNFDGIDIDYENKKAETAASFSRFIRMLSAALHKEGKTFSCSVEARTPLHARLIVIPKDFKYANDYYVLEKYCDEVRVLAYDQRHIDLTLNKEKGGDKLYMPVADPAWVEKVINETKRYVAPQKIILGIPTFGYEYKIIKNGERYSYEKWNSVSYKKAMDLANSLNIKPERNSAGELSFTYATSTADLTATSTRLVWFTDTASITDKIKLAKKHKIRGAIFFKFDGETDPEIWNKF